MDGCTMTDEPQKHAETLIRTLRDNNHPEHAARFADVLSGNLVGAALLSALRELSDTLMAGVEALDPSAVVALENFRLSVDRHLTSGRADEPPANR
jgi:hypothetical protein